MFLFIQVGHLNQTENFSHVINMAKAAFPAG